MKRNLLVVAALLALGAVVAFGYRRWAESELDEPYLAPLVEEHG
jgi:hypothetical protein